MDKHCWGLIVIEMGGSLRCICDSCVQCVLSVLFSVMMRGADITLYPASGVFAVIMISDISFQSLMDHLLSQTSKPDFFPFTGESPCCYLC